jgi:hypothetical protein
LQRAKDYIKLFQFQQNDKKEIAVSSSFFPHQKTFEFKFHQTNGRIFIASKNEIHQKERKAKKIEWIPLKRILYSFYHKDDNFLAAFEVAKQNQLQFCNLSFILFFIDSKDENQKENMKKKLVLLERYFPNRYMIIEKAAAVEEKERIQKWIQKHGIQKIVHHHQEEEDEEEALDYFA